MSAGVIASSALTVASSKTSLLRASTFLKMLFTFENASSMGLKSGEQGGKNRKVAPAPSMSSCSRFDLCTERLSITTIDPDACLTGHVGSTARMGYKVNYAVDGGKARVILTALVTKADLKDNQPMLDLIWHTTFRWKLRPHHVTGYSVYGTIPNVKAVEQAGIKAYMPVIDYTWGKRALFRKDEFTYDAERDVGCYPAGETLKKPPGAPSSEKPSSSHEMERMRLRMLERVNCEALITASGQNVKRLLTFGGRGPRRPAQVVALRPPKRPPLRLDHRRTVTTSVRSNATFCVSQHAARIHTVLSILGGRYLLLAPASSESFCRDQHELAKERLGLEILVGLVDLR